MNIQASILDRWNELIREGDREAYLLDIRDNLFVPMVLNNQLDVIFFKIAELISENNLKLTGSPGMKDIHMQFVRRYDEAKDPFDKILISSMLYLIEIFSGDSKNAKSDFVERLSTLNIFELCFKPSTVIESINFIIRAIFKMPDELLYLFKDIVFDEKGFFKKDISVQKSNLMWVMHFFWPVYGEETVFLDLYERWIRLFSKAIEHNLTELVFYMHFPISHVYMNATQTQNEWKRLNDDLEMPLSKYIMGKVVQEYGIREVVRETKNSGRPIKVGFVYDRIVKNTPFVVLYSLLKVLVENNNGKYDFYVYDLSREEQSTSDPEAVDMLSKLGVKYADNHALIEDNDKGLYYNHFNKCLKLRNKIVTDKIDILIVENNTSQFNLLLSTRSAPVQIYWSHGNFAYDVEGIDLKISHYTSYCPYEKECNYNLFHVPLDNGFLNPPVDINKVREVRKRWPSDRIILGSVARLIKFNSRDFLYSLSEIMRQNPDTVFLACGVGGKEEINEEIKRLGIDKRFYFEGYIDQHVYGHVIDIMLDTFPAPVGVAKDEFAAKGGCIVMHGKYNNYALVEQYVEFFRQKGFREEEIPVAFTNEDYLRIATLMIRNSELRRKVGTAYKEFLSCNRDGEEFFKILETVSCNEEIFTAN